MSNRLLFLIALLLITRVASAQIVGGNVFLQGHWIEVGEDNMGAFGTCSSPVGYHPHVCCGTTTAFTPGGNLDVVYDWGHDGWSVGSPQLMGDYTIPGYPQEGWGMQVGATEYRNWAGGGICTGPFNIPGSVTGYSNSGGKITSTWTGNVAGLHVVQETRVDTNASWVVVTTRIYNTTAGTINNVWYERTCDPDNTSFWNGTPVTENIIVHQNEDSRHMVMVGTHGKTTTGTITFNTTNSYLGLCTRDCRAKCGVVPNLYPTNTPQQLWAGTGVTLSIFNDSNYQDQGIFLVFNIGNIAPLGSPGDSAVVSYAYVYNGPRGVDSAFPDPGVIIGGNPFPANDTFNLCSLPPGVDTVPLDLTNVDKDWTWGSWTWSPGTGLSATTGTHVVLSGALIGTSTTYTVTGTDSALGMYSCNRIKLIFTIKPCVITFDACYGDTLFLNMPGDSTGATYYWWGPGGFTSYIRNPYIYPATFADTGAYHVVKTHGGGLLHDTLAVHVVIHPQPVVTLTSNITACVTQIQPTLDLFSTLDSVGETFSWSGPFGFTSTLQSPVITPFDSSLAGTYVCTGKTVWGCKNTTTINIHPRATLWFQPIYHYGCDFDTVYFDNFTYNANTYTWTFGDATPTDPQRNTYHIYNAHHPFSVQLRTGNLWGCVDTLTRIVDLTHDIHARQYPTPDTICFDGGATVAFLDSSTADDSSFVGLVPATYAWHFGDGGTDVTAAPSHLYTAPGKYLAKLVVTDAMGCPDSMLKDVYVVQMHMSLFADTLLCISQPLALTSIITTIPPGFDVPRAYAWTQSEPNLDSLTIQSPHVSGIGNFTDIVTVTMPGVVPDGCPITDTVVIHSVLGAAIGDLTVSQTILYGSSIQLYASGQVYYRWLPNDGSLDNNNINNPIATPEHTTTYSVFGLDGNGCLDSAYITVYVDTSSEDGVPCAFTPNHDGINDIFKPTGIKFQRMVEMRIYNRWGEEVYYTNNREVGWDGTYHGMPQDIGTYFYQIIVAEPSGNNKVYKGPLTLIR